MPLNSVPWILKHGIRWLLCHQLSLSYSRMLWSFGVWLTTRHLIYLHLEVTNMGGAAGGMPWPRTSPLSPQSSSASSSLAQQDMTVSLQHRTPLVSLKEHWEKPLRGMKVSLLVSIHQPRVLCLLSAGRDGKGALFSSLKTSGRKKNNKKKPQTLLQGHNLLGFKGNRTHCSMTV